MPTQEERLLALELGHKEVVEAVKDINHYVTMMYGVIGQQGVDIRDIKTGMRTMDERLSSLDTRFTTLEQSVNSRLETQDKKLDQVLLMLSTLVESQKANL